MLTRQVNVSVNQYYCIFKKLGQQLLQFLIHLIALPCVQVGHYIR